VKDSKKLGQDKIHLPVGCLWIINTL